MALESPSFRGIDKLKQRLKERYPNHNFDIPQEPDTKHKAPSICLNNDIFYTDVEGNKYCGARYKQVDENNPYQWTFRECHALVKKADQGGKQDEIPF